MNYTSVKSIPLPVHESYDRVSIRKSEAAIKSLTKSVENLLAVYFKF